MKKLAHAIMIVVLRRAHLALLLLTPYAFSQTTQDGPPVTFHTQTGLVLLSFHVLHGKNYVKNLQPTDVVLLEDGKPREFTIFDSPATQGRMPLELVLLFDTNQRIDYFWEPTEVFRFIRNWDESMSRDILDRASTDIRVSLYRCDGQTLYRLSRATTEPQRFTASIRGLLSLDFRGPGPDPAVFQLSLPAKRDHVDRGPFTQNYETSYFVSAEERGWPMEAAIGVLDDVASAGDKVARIFVMFSEGIGATTTIPEDVGNQSLDLGIPIYPIATNYANHIGGGRFPRNRFRMDQFRALAKMTGGRDAEYPAIDAALLRKILESVKEHGLSQYVVGFSPSTSSGTTKQHRLEIKLVSKSSGSLEGGKRRAIY